MRFLLKILFTLFLSNLIACSYAAEASGAKQVITKYFEAIRLYDTALMADSMHPEALSLFRDSMNGALYGPKSEVAKAEILPLFAVASLEEYKNLSDKEAYKRLNDVIASAQPDLLKLMKTSTFNILTENIRGDVTYFTYELTLNINGQNVSKDVVQKLKLHDGIWMLLLAADAEATIAGIAARYN